MVHMNSKMKMKNWIGYDCWCLHHMVNYLSEAHLKLLIVVHYKTATQDNRSIIALISKFEANRQWHLPLKNNAHQSTLLWNTWYIFKFQLETKEKPSRYWSETKIPSTSTLYLSHQWRPYERVYLLNQIASSLVIRFWRCEQH